MILLHSMKSLNPAMRPYKQSTMLAMASAQHSSLLILDTAQAISGRRFVIVSGPEAIRLCS